MLLKLREPVSETYWLPVTLGIAAPGLNNIHFHKKKSNTFLEKFFFWIFAHTWFLRYTLSTLFFAKKTKKQVNYGYRLIKWSGK